MSENLDAILETKVQTTESSRQPQFSSPKLTLSVLRFVAGASLIIGLLVGIGSFLLFLVATNSSNASARPEPLLLVSIGALAQGFIIFALFNALALIIENLVAIRENSYRTGNKL